MLIQLSGKRLALAFSLFATVNVCSAHAEDSNGESGLSPTLLAPEYRGFGQFKCPMQTAIVMEPVSKQEFLLSCQTPSKPLSDHDVADIELRIENSLIGGIHGDVTRIRLPERVDKDIWRCGNGLTISMASQSQNFWVYCTASAG